MSATTIEIPQLGAAGALDTRPDGTTVAPPPQVVRVPVAEVVEVSRYPQPQGGYTGEVLLVDGARHPTTDVDVVCRAVLEGRAAARRQGRRR